MVDYIQAKLEKLGAVVTQEDVGNQLLHDGKTIKLPNVIMGYLGNVSMKNLTILYNVHFQSPSSHFCYILLSISIFVLNKDKVQTMMDL